MHATYHNITHIAYTRLAIIYIISVCIIVTVLYPDRYGPEQRKGPHVMAAGPDGGAKLTCLISQNGVSSKFQASCFNLDLYHVDRKE